MKASSSQREARLVEWLTPHVFGHRMTILIAFVAITAVMIYAALTGLRIDTNFTKQLPLEHEYMQTFIKHQEEFGGANRVLVAVIAREGNMFTPEFFRALRTATDEVFFIRGVDRARVQSLYTPNVRYTEVVEDGIQAGNVIPADFQPTPEGLAQVRENILKAGIVGRLVANDFSGAIVSATLQDFDPETGKPLDYIRVAHDLETKIRNRLMGGKVHVQVQSSTAPVEVHMIGFAKIVGDIADGSMSVAMFAGITVVLTLLSVWLYIQSFKVALIPVVCSIVAVIWQLGMLVFLGYGVDPLGILVPFIIFAIGVSHGVQKISAVKDAALAGDDSMTAAQRTFRQLFLPAIVALLADLVGFITILLIPVQVIREMAITASLGVGIVILTDLVLLPVLVSYVSFDAGYRARIERRNAHVAALLGLVVGHCEARPCSCHHRHRRRARPARLVEGARNPDRRHPGGCSGATARFPLQRRLGHHHPQVLDRRRHHQCHRRDAAGRVHRLRRAQCDGPFRLAHGKCRWHPERARAPRGDEDRELRVERGEPEVAQHSS